MANYIYTKVGKAEVFDLEITYVVDDEPTLAFVEVVHKGYVRPFNKQKRSSRQDLVDCIIDDLLRDAGNDISGFIPYNNFESSFAWRLRVRSPRC